MNNKDLLDLAVKQLSAVLESDYNSFFLSEDGAGFLDEGGYRIRWSHKDPDSAVKSTLIIDVDIKSWLQRTVTLTVWVSVGDVTNDKDSITYTLSKFSSLMRKINKLRDKYKALSNDKEAIRASRKILKVLENSFPTIIDDLILKDDE